MVMSLSYGVSAACRNLRAAAVVVAAASADSFALRTEKGEDIDTRGFGSYDRNAYLPEYSGQIYATYLANRTATYVFGLDYSAWRPDRAWPLSPSHSRARRVGHVPRR